MRQNCFSLLKKRSTRLRSRSIVFFQQIFILRLAGGDGASITNAGSHAHGAGTGAADTGDLEAALLQ